MKAKTKQVSDNNHNPPKTVKELRAFLETKMEQTNTSWVNPFRDDAYNKDLAPIVHTYRSQAVDEALKFFLSKYLGEDRRIQLLGEEWTIVT